MASGHQAERFTQQNVENSQYPLLACNNFIQSTHNVYSSVLSYCITQSDKGRISTLMAAVAKDTAAIGTILHTTAAGFYHVHPSYLDFYCIQCWFANHFLVQSPYFLATVPPPPNISYIEKPAHFELHSLNRELLQASFMMPEFVSPDTIRNKACFLLALGCHSSFRYVYIRGEGEIIYCALPPGSWLRFSKFILV